MKVLKHLLQKVFNFGKQDKEDKTSATALKKADISDARREKSEAVSECFSLLRAAEEQKKEKLSREALATLEKIVDIIEREGL